MESPYVEEKPQIRKVISYSQRQQFQKDKPSSKANSPNVNEQEFVQKKLRDLKGNPQILIKLPNQPMFQTRMLGRSQSSIQMDIPKQVSDNLNIIGQKSNKVKFFKRIPQQTLKYQLRNEPQAVEKQVQSDHADLKVYNKQVLKKYKEVILKLLTDQNYALTREYLDDDSYLDFKQQMIPLNQWKHYAQAAQGSQFSSLYSNFQGKPSYNLHQDDVDDILGNTLNLVDEFTKDDEDQINNYHNALEQLQYTSQSKVQTNKQFLPNIYNRINSQSMLHQRQNFKSIAKKTKEEAIKPAKENSTTRKQIQCVNVNKLRNSASMLNLKAKQFNRKEKEISLIQLNDLLENQLHRVEVEKDLSARSNSEEKKRVLGVKELNKFRQKITNENLQYHLLAHNLSDNLKRLRICWECENYEELRNQIQGAIHIQQSLKKQFK